MKERLNKFIHSRIFIIILVIILMCTTMLVGTYAWFTWNSTDNTEFVMSIGRLADVVFSSGNDIYGDLTPVYDYKDGLSTSFTVNNRDTSGTVLNYDIKLNITSIADELISEDVKWALEKNNHLLSEGNLSDVSNGASIILSSDFSLLDTVSYTFYLYIDGNVENDPSMMGKNITGNIMIENVEVDYASSINLLNHITNLYIGNNPTLITHSKDDGTSDTYYYSYQDDTETWGLMNDGLKVSETYGAGATTITDDSVLISGTEGNIRYFGPSDAVNNYIYFNCQEYPATNCELWRIIGIVDGKVKLIRSESIGNYSWDNKNTITGAETDYGSNDWSNARLMRLLNPGFENFTDKDNSNNDLIANNSLYWNSGSGICYSGQNNATKACDFSTTGIKNDTTRNMILQSIWYLGGFSSTYIYADETYNYERTNSTSTIYGGNPYTINTKIGLMYLSDYGYGTDLRKCNKEIDDYDKSENSNTCTINNWLFNRKYQKLISPALNSGLAITVDPSGGLFENVVYSSYGVSPVLYLNTELNILSVGDGSKTSPYRITLENSVETQSFTPLSEFTYILGSEQSTVSELTSCYYDDYIGDLGYSYSDCYMDTKSIAPISLESNEILLVRYNGDAPNVSIPNTYVVDGTTYNVVVLSSAEYFDDLVGAYEFITGLFYNNLDIESVYFASDIEFIQSEIWWGSHMNDEETEEYYADYYMNNNSAKHLFAGCTSLINVSQIPNTVTNVNETFEGCTSLETAPVIPSSVTSMSNTFYNCKNLTGTIIINSSSINYADYWTFYGTEKAITVMAPVGSTTYNTFNSASLPSNVTLKAFSAS